MFACGAAWLPPKSSAPLQVGQLIAELDPHWSDRLAEMRFVGQHEGGSPGSRITSDRRR
jgi:hypothetical protein